PEDFIEIRGSNSLDSICRGVYNFGKDLFKLAVFSCVLGIAFYAGKIYEGAVHIPERIDFEQNSKTHLDVIVDNQHSTLSYNEELSEDSLARVVFTSKEYWKNKRFSPYSTPVVIIRQIRSLIEDIKNKEYKQDNEPNSPDLKINFRE
ncbi:MAG TPA: hypothetical protein VJ438_05070, partial [Candidatus Nanoarchaeia archaeon]|nr:hypothetical protein [Candidatus Nanoarchaeia archaeon]